MPPYWLLRQKSNSKTGTWARRKETSWVTIVLRWLAVGLGFPIHECARLNLFSQGHCRRRKIRCITSPNDTQGRCINCIRLKKDCSFFPVDQASIDDSRSKQTSKSSTAPKGSSATSSPATPISNPIEQPKKTKPPFVPSSKRPGPIAVPKITEAEGVKGFSPQTKGSSIIIKSLQC